MSTTDVAGPLRGFRVIDLTHMLAGPYATMMLADFGADVIKIESQAGEFIRRSGPFLSDDDAYGGYFASVNRNKASVCLDLKAPEGREVFLELVAGSDALVENFRAGVMERLGFSYEALREVNPRLVYGCIRGFGDPRTGVSPYVDWPAYDVIAQAMGGLMGITGDANGAPTKTGPGLGDIFPASLLINGVLAAMLDAQRSGRGRFVDVAMYDAIVSLCERLVYQHSITGAVPSRIGNAHPFFAPFGVYRAEDGWIAIAAPNDDLWARLAAIMGRQDLVGDHPFARSANRTASRDEVVGIVSDWAARHTIDVLKELLGAQIPFGPVQTVDQIVADEHVAARRMVRAVDHPGSGARISIAGQPVKFGGPPEAEPRSAPLLGADTNRVLSDLGYSADAIDSLREEGVTR
ncbi:CoA transferase [Actinomycetospora sp. NBRC 106375]|uniref:CaiB/BaiF CoA transferase family protein n=1 Tax=Actinomycetospora sp. NBRC 106375 TaxID=3032207 RepID=UPI0024A27392|nr:CoA transferase [Actinomycetospora sp. NBRC 106375]GLZ49870.1 CoA transferase [Actinomycetospora sp. NBRC 106375]